MPDSKSNKRKSPTDGFNDMLSSLPQKKKKNLPSWPSRPPENYKTKFVFKANLRLVDHESLRGVAARGVILEQIEQSNKSSKHLDEVAKTIRPRGLCIFGKTMDRELVRNFSALTSYCRLDKSITAKVVVEIDIIKELENLTIEDVEEQCAICLESLDIEIASLPCSHNYHRRCFGTWLQKKQDCPLCRRPFCSTTQAFS